MINLTLRPKDLLAINAEISTGILIKKSELESIFSSYMYEESVELQICSIFRSIVNNHCFSDGNKRTAAVALSIMCEDNNLVISDEKLYQVTIKIATSQLKSVSDISAYLF